MSNVDGSSSSSECESRREWFWKAEEQARGIGSHILSEQACALTIDLEIAFRSGAWVAVIVLAMAAIDAVLRELEIPGHVGSTKALIDDVSSHLRVGGAALRGRLHVLRIRRNALLHLDPASPEMTVDRRWDQEASLEEEAREAIRLVFEVFYMNPGT